MTERYGNDREYPHLASWELEALVERARASGIRKEVDYPEDQIPDQYFPYSYVLSIDPEPFEVLVEEWRQHGFETVTSAEIEYAQARVLEVGGLPMPPTVYVSISSVIYHRTNPTVSITKDTIYMLPLDAYEEGVVKETYTESDRGRYEFLQGDWRSMLELMANETRNLTQDDIDLLRILLSSE